MFSAVATFLTSELATVLKRKLVVYGLMAVSGLLLLVAASWTLGAIHAALAVRLSSIAASLIMAGAFFFMSICSASIAIILSRSPRSKSASSEVPGPFLLASTKRYKAGYAAGALALIAGATLAAWGYSRRERHESTPTNGRRLH